MSEFSDKITILDEKLTYRAGGVTICAEGWGRDGLRVRILPEEESGAGSDWALDIPLHVQAQIECGENDATIRNGKISMRVSDIYTQDGFLTFSRLSGGKWETMLEEYNYIVHAHNPLAHSFRPCDTERDLYHSELRFAGREGERFYGMGENEVGRLNLKGVVIDLYQRHIKAPVPFVVSSEGYGFLWNNPSLGRVEFTHEQTRWVSYGTRQIDFYITAGDSPADIMANYADAAGHTPAFPYWASGFWQCKLRYKTQDELLGVAREYKRLGLPLSVIVIDFYHWDHTGNWRLDPVCWPDPDAMVKELRDMGVRIMISPWTMVKEGSINYEHMKEHGMFTGAVRGADEKVDFDGGAYQYDPTNPGAAAYLWSKWKENYVDHGITTFWLDPCDEFHSIPDYDKATYHIGSALECHSMFVTAHQKNIYEGLLAAGEKEIVNICRNAWAGTQRYGACPAPHDIECSFRHLKAYVRVGLNVMMSGILWWNCDIGGFITHDNTSDEFQELMIRWYQYGVFLPVFRTHGYRPNNEAWNIGGDSYRHIRASLLLRERLRPYVMEQMEAARECGVPPMRPCFFDFPEDGKAWEVEDAFMFGPDVLAAPVTDYLVRSREVYLPCGCRWIDAWSGKVYDGGQKLLCDAPLGHIPVFVRHTKPELAALIVKEE